MGEARKSSSFPSHIFPLSAQWPPSHDGIGFSSSLTLDFRSQVKIGTVEVFYRPGFHSRPLHSQVRVRRTVDPKCLPRIHPIQITWFQLFCSMIGIRSFHRKDNETKRAYYMSLLICGPGCSTSRSRKDRTNHDSGEVYSFTNSGAMFERWSVRDCNLYCKDERAEYLSASARALLHLDG